MTSVQEQVDEKKYVISEDKLWQLRVRKKKNPLGPGHGSKYLSMGHYEIDDIFKSVKSHPLEDEMKNPIKLCDAFGDIDCCPNKAECSVVKYCAEHYRRMDKIIIERNKVREDVMDEFKWIKPMCFGRHEAICDTRCAWVVRKRCIESSRKGDNK